jgi:hypothetical protein
MPPLCLAEQVAAQPDGQHAVAALGVLDMDLDGEKVNGTPQIVPEPIMSTSSFYEAAVRSVKSPEMRSLMADLLKRAQERESLLAQFAEQLQQNRTRREGKPFKLTKAAKEWLRDADDAARKAAQGHAERVAKLSDEQILRVALSGWDTAIQFHNPAAHHEDDRAFALRIDRHNKAAMRLIKSFYRAHGMPIPTLARGGGICFTAAFQREVPDLGTLGNDCMAIEPAFAALDKVCQKAKLPPLSDYVNHDPDRLLGKKTTWFDAGAGLATVRGLIQRLGQSARTVKNAKTVVQELRTLEQDLAQAELHKIRFHFVMLD